MRKLFVYICFMLLLGNSAKAYLGGNSAYGIYQLASSGNIRAIQSTLLNGGNIDAEDGTGQNPICYAIRNSDYVAYKNLVLLKADEHPSCVSRISKQEYENFKRGYEIRGGKIASSFSFGKAGMWTLAGVGVAGAAVGIAAAAGGGGGGSSSGGSDTPTPPTPPTPSEPCASYDLIYCADHGVCDECIGSNRSYYKLTGCQDGYVLNTKKTGCLVNTEIRTEYPLEECDKNGTCASAKSGEDTVYKLLSCNDGYKLSADKMSCIKICPGYTQETCPKSAQYLSETCSEDNSYHICTNRTNVIGCNDFSLNEDKCTGCRDGYKLINGECKPKCQGYTQVSCDNQTQYIKEKCSDDETYHKCASRNHSEGCDILATDSDTCLLCKEGFKLNSSNICEKLCDGYTRISCDRSQYISGFCDDDTSYHKCEDRKKSTTGCMDVSLTEDACQTCYDGYKLVDGVCNEICAGYTNFPCNNSLEYIKETCSENNLYHKCQSRLNTEGCSNFDTNADKCTSCDKGYELSTEGKCIQVECLGYKNTACDKPTEYISETCADDPLFHKCKQRTNVTGCNDFKLDADVCTGCVSGYSINNGICEFSCPGYTNVACNNNTQYQSSTCLKDNTYHICTWRTNTEGCATFSETSDTCTSCLQGYTLKSGRCEFDCPTMYEYECDFYTEYISEVCPTAPTYHICSERKNTEHCTDYNTYKDECTACEDEYMVKNGKCTHICSGYQKEACDPIDTYYAVSDCTDPGGSEYHKCVERTNLTGCKRFSPSSDKCLECEDGYTLQEGTCSNNTSLCKDYVNTPCTNETQYIGETCSYDQSYHKCLARTKSTVGCKTLNPNADECSVCSDGYMHDTEDASICVEKCPSSSGYKKDCNTNIYVLGVACANDSEYHICTQIRTKIVGCSSYVVNDDKCAECSSGYILSEDGKTCSEKCPGYAKSCDRTQYLDKTQACEDDSSYYMCVTRTNLNGCKDVAVDADKCLSCESGYHPLDDGCVKDEESASQSSDEVLRSSVMSINEPVFYGMSITNSETENGKNIHILSTGNEVFGMATDNSKLTNNASINIKSDTADKIYGIHALNSSIVNSGNIELNAKGGEIYGIYSDNSRIENSGNITINADDIDNAYGIYAINNSAIKNSGIITINGESSNSNAADGKFIYIDGTSSIINADTIVSNMSLNTEDLGGGSILMMKGSNITAPEVAGNLILGADIIRGSNDDIYVTPDLVTGDTQNLSVSSQSAMFKASINNDNYATDGILTRNSFNSLIDDSSIADYLEHNYTAGNASDLFNKLKQAESLSQLNRNISDLLGRKMLARMTFEDMSMLREINLDMNDNMFKEEGAFALSGTVSPSSYVNDVGSIGRYAINGFNHGKTSYALGISISDVSTYDDNKENSRSDRSFVMSAPLGYKTRGFELITSPKIGYAYGEYSRNGLDGTYNGKVYKRMYALMNEARYPLNWGKMKFTPSAEFNMIGFNVKGNEDNQKPYYLRIKPQKHYSVETGIGLTAEKEFSLYKFHNFKINGGMAFYHEFANPYELDVSMSEMDGTYRLHDEKRHDNRTVVRFGLDYGLGEDVDVSASLLSNIDGECRTDATCDIKYHF